MDCQQHLRMLEILAILGPYIITGQFVQYNA